MSKLIKHNNKQYGGTYVTIKSDDGDDFIRTDDDERIIPDLFEASISIKCINYSSVFSIVFVCELPNGDTKIRLHSEVNPDNETLKFCIKITLVKTERTPVNTSGLIFNYSGKNFQKEIVSQDEATKESNTQKIAHDKLLERCHKDIISDTIAVQTVSPETFQRYTEAIFTKKQTDEDETLTKYAVEWLIDSATEKECNIHIFVMDFLDGYTPFNQVLWPLENALSSSKSVNKIDSVREYLSEGYFRDVYKFMESAAAQVISILGITGNWNLDLNSGNILVSQDHFDTKVIDFGMNINLQKDSERLEILTHFTNYNIGLVKNSFFLEQANLNKFLDSLTESSSSMYTITKTFSSCYQQIISNIATDIELLLITGTKLESKRQIVFQVLMFLAFIDGLLIKQKFQQNGLQCRELMKYVFNCEIFDSLSKFYKFSSLQYTKFLPKAFNCKINYIPNFNFNQYTRLCNTILDNICNNVIRLLSVSCERVGVGVGGRVISKKISTKRRPRRKSSANKHRRHRRRTSRK